MTDAELEAALVPAEFTVGEVEIAKRVLERLLANATDLAGALENWLDRRPAKNEQPEIDGLIRGLARLWCAAFKVPIARIKISESSGSPAASFIEAGVTMFLGKTLSRKSIVTHVIAYRDEEKAKLS
ncbi:hypothetical protein EN766_33885 [Mesorhizobium sp. M2A.F.Ca.ET.046.02.1.1]|nr:hypothetical protein EN766_33885 [Mesorhizobium sp. M2A.F.Ca.ET.046.02.1.1]